MSVCIKVSVFRGGMARAWDGMDPSSYIDDFNVHQILKDAIQELCQRRPHRPYQFLSEYFARLERASTNRSNSMDSTESQQSG